MNANPVNLLNVRIVTPILGFAYLSNRNPVILLIGLDQSIFKVILPNIPNAYDLLQIPDEIV